MPEEPETTTVEVKMNTWAALDKLKERGDSFNDVIQRLLDNAAVDVNTLDGAQFEPIYDDVEPIPDGAAVTEGCAQVDPITGDPCDNDPTHKQDYRFESEDEWSTFYYCDEHRPDTVAEIAAEE